MNYRSWSTIFLTALIGTSSQLFQSTTAFSPIPNSNPSCGFTKSYNTRTSTSSSKSTTLFAIGVLARKAKEMEIKKYMESEDLEPEVLAKYELVQASVDSSITPTTSEFQKTLTKRKGTITVIAEYKRRLDKGGFIDEVYDPEILSPTFREFGASAIAIMTDERMGGCTYDDMKKVHKEQSIAVGDMPGPVSLVSSDLIVHPIQVARSANAGASAVVLNYALLGGKDGERFIPLLQACQKLELDAIVSVDTKEEAQGAVDAGATIIMTTVSSSIDGLSPKERFAMIEDLSSSNYDTPICKIANIISRDDKALQEVEDAWICRDSGFQAVWASDFLYKSGNDALEHPGAIISSIKAKSSVKWASPKARGGKGEGAREYLGDILM